MYQFCPDSQAFYPLEMKALYEKAGTWPTRGISVGEVDYRRLINNVPPGHRIGADVEGKPKYVPLTPMSPEDVLKFNKQILQVHLDKIRPLVQELEDRQSDGLISPAQREQFSKLKAYRRELLSLDLSKEGKWPRFDATLLDHV